MPRVGRGRSSKLRDRRGRGEKTHAPLNAEGRVQSSSSTSVVDRAGGSRSCDTKSMLREQHSGHESLAIKVLHSDHVAETVLPQIWQTSLPTNPFRSDDEVLRKHVSNSRASRLLWKRVNTIVTRASCDCNS
jgi:hypothetical protein